MDWSRIYTEGVKVWLAGGAVLLALLWPRLPRAWSRQLLAFLLVVSFVNYQRWGFEASTVRVDAYEMLHYYVNAKYFDELGYLDLYPAVLLVDADNGGPFYDQGSVYLDQDETGHHTRPISHGIARGQQVRDTKFTEARWSQFEHDVLYLQRTLGCRDRNRKGRCLREMDDKLWRQLINDHGFNGTTAWAMIARPIASAVPVEAVKALGYLDVGLLLAAIGAVIWAYGGTAAAWTALFLLTTYSTRWPYFSWVFLRYDWVAGLILATALLKRGHPLLAGVFAGWSSVLRMFPAMWMWGPLAKGLAGLSQKHVHKQLLVFAGGFLLSIGVLQGAATVVLGVDQVETHYENMLDHNAPEQLSSRRIGLALALATPPWELPGIEQVITQERKAIIEHQQGLRFAVAGLLMLGLGWGLRRSSDDEAYAFGFLPFFLLTTASYYYYVARVTLAVVHAGELDRSLRHRVGLASLFALEVFSNAAQRWMDGERLFLIGGLAWGILIYAVVQVAWLLVEARRTPEEPA